jgi:hypothetical protein
MSIVNAGTIEKIEDPGRQWIADVAVFPSHCPG